MPTSRRARTALRLALLLGAAGAATPAALAGEPAAGVVFEPATTTFAQALAKAKAASKPVFVDFFTEW